MPKNERRRDRQFHWKNPATRLLTLLLVTGLLVTGVGALLKHRYIEGTLAEENMAAAVPFLLMRGDVSLAKPKPTEEGATKPTEDPVTESEDSFSDALSPPEEDLAEVATSEVDEIPGASASVFGPVEESYFNSVLFIGDSRTVGLSYYGRLGQADYFATVGLSSLNLFETSAEDQGFSAQSLESLLASRSYSHIYIMLGINEIGYPVASQEQAFLELLHRIQNLQPEAEIIFQANLPVTQARATSNTLFSLENIAAQNARIAALADGEQVHFLDLSSHFCDDLGYLKAELTGDGTHPYAVEYERWGLLMKDYGLIETGA